MDNRRADSGTPEVDVDDAEFDSLYDVLCDARDAHPRVNDDIPSSDLACHVFAWMAENGYRKQPEPEWEYAAASPDGRHQGGSETSCRALVDSGALPQFTILVRRRRAGAWRPVEEGQR